MSHFTGLSDWCEITPSGRYQTTKPVPWEIGVKGSELWVVVPVGYLFDVSIPRPLWSVLDPADPRFHKAACLHDYLLEVSEWSRVSAAGAFADALLASGVGKWTRLAMALSVIAWNWR
jgi:hypothetical protein